MEKKNNSKNAKGFSAEEVEAMKEYIKEKNMDKKDMEKAVLEKINTMNGNDKIIGKRLHSIITANAPMLKPRLWYGMPAYAKDNGNIVCFFQCAQKFKARYATLGFSDKAHLDDGSMWSTSFAIKELSSAEEKKIVALVKRAIS